MKQGNHEEEIGEDGGSVPLLSCSLAVCVPPVDHDGAADGEEGCGLEASGWEVSLGKEGMSVSILSSSTAVLFLLSSKTRHQMGALYVWISRQFLS